MWLIVTGKESKGTVALTIQRALKTFLRSNETESWMFSDRTHISLRHAFHSCSFLPFSALPSLSHSEGLQQLYAGDKSVRWWVLASDWPAQLPRWCEDCRLCLSKGHSIHGCHLMTSPPQKTTIWTESLWFTPCYRWWLGKYTLFKIMSPLRAQCVSVSKIVHQPQGG